MSTFGRCDIRSSYVVRTDRWSWQINEAFASQFAYCVEQLQVPIEKINPKFVVCLPQALLSVLIV